MKPATMTARLLALSASMLMGGSVPVAAAPPDTRNEDGMKKAAAAAPIVVPPADRSAVVPGSCAPLDLVFVIDDTGSMGPAIASVKAGLETIIETAEQAAGSDLRLGLLTFKDNVTVHHALTADLDAVRNSIDALTASGGAGGPEASDEAKNTVVNNLAGGTRTDSAGRSGTQVGDFTIPYRPEAEKIVVLITDAPPGGFDDVSDPADRSAMHTHAETARDKGIKISDVFVPTDGDYAGQRALLEDDAVTSGGAFLTVAPDGSGTGEAVTVIVEQCGRGLPPEDVASSSTHPAAELVMPFDSTAGKSSFLLVSNLNGISPRAPQVSTHWVFWSDTCEELADVSICLTLNDTVVVDPLRLRAVSSSNEELGPLVNLAGKRGLVTVTAYETDGACSDFRATGSILRDDAIVGAYTIADEAAGYAFGRDAEGFGTDNPTDPTRVVLPPISTGDRFALQVFEPSSTDANMTVLAHLRAFDRGPIEPVKGELTFSTAFTDSMEISVSLPDVTVSCVQFLPLSPGLIPAGFTTDSAGLFSFRAESGFEEEEDALFAIVGQAVGPFGAVSRLKTIPE